MLRKNGNFVKTISISLGITVIVILLVMSGAWRRVENMTSDAMYQKPTVIPNDIKIIAIDEETLSRLGPYSDWNRSYFTQLIEILNQKEDAAPRVIGIDVLFSGTNGSDEDVQLAETAGRYQNIVLASSLNFGSYLVKGEDGRYHSAGYVSGEGKPYDALAAAAPYGFTNAIFDEDGIVRKNFTQVRSEYEGETLVYDSFAYRIAYKAQDKISSAAGTPSGAEEGQAGDGSGMHGGYPAKVECILAGKPGEFEKISMASVLEGKIPAEYFADCIVLVGAYEEGLMDSYRVPNDYSKEMYGVELQANYIYAFLNDRMMYDTKNWLKLLLTAVVIGSFSCYSLNAGMRKSAAVMAGVIAFYLVLTKAIFSAISYKLPVLAVPVGVIFAFLVSLLYRYVEMQKRRAEEMQETMFSMAEAMAEAIEGRTPYNANHTKNVARRCVEMLDFINQKHREKKTELHFSDADKRQLYLAAMLHDVGKMDVPLEVMDKPTKLGSREKELSDRLRIIMLKWERDALRGEISKAEAEDKIGKIQAFLDKLDAFNCGRPLKEDEWQMVDEIAESVYVSPEGEEIAYLAQEEIDDLHIRAGTLSDQERTIMQSHVVYTDKILSHIKFGEQFPNVRDMASNHHELLNGKGYPNGIGEKEIDVMTGILTIMDIYDSLIADDRPYKKPKSISAAFEILDEEAEAGKVDKELLEFAKELYLAKESC